MMTCDVALFSFLGRGPPPVPSRMSRVRPFRRRIGYGNARTPIMPAAAATNARRSRLISPTIYLLRYIRSRAHLHVSTRRTAPRDLGPAVQAPGRQDAVQSAHRLDGSLLRDHGRARRGARAWLVPGDAARPPAREESSRVGACDGPRQPRRDGERTRGPGRTAYRRPGHRLRLLHLLSEEGAWLADGRVPCERHQRDG